MPVLSELVFGALASRQDLPRPVAGPATNTIAPDLQVICAWPVSGQYGPGSRVLYYVLVAACVFARKVDWLRNACVAGALLFPVLAALHGIVLASVHIDGAVDLDVYGAFQLCAIGALAGPVTVRISKTYFNDPGRNTIFAWSCIILAGLLSLTVEFYRLDSSSCTKDDRGNPISRDPKIFPYGNANCGLVCNEVDGPFSPLRGGSANNIYVVPAPSKLSFDTATLLCAACCIPAVLLLVWMWIKILREDWQEQTQHNRSISGQSHENDNSGEQNGALTAIRTSETERVRANQERLAFRRALATYAEVLVFGSLILVILVLGEINLFSKQVFYQTEPIANIGQWQPVVGTGLAVLGSLYLLIAQAMKEEREANEPDISPPVKLKHSVEHDKDVFVGNFDGGDRAFIVSNHKESTRCMRVDLTAWGLESATVTNLWTGRTMSLVTAYTIKIGPHCSVSLRLSNVKLKNRPQHDSAIRECDFPAITDIDVASDEQQTDQQQGADETESELRCQTQCSAERRTDILHRVAQIFIRISDFFGQAAPDSFGSNFRKGIATGYPTTPGEEFRNPDLRETRSTYGEPVDSDESIHSRGPPSPIAGSAFSGSQAQGTLTGSPEPAHRRSNTLSSESGIVLRRMSTLEVPTPPLRQSFQRSGQPSTPDDAVVLLGSEVIPAITLSSEVDST